MPFVISVTRGPLTVIEVVYPAHPTAADVADYVEEMKRTIDAHRDEPWVCLVDQRNLTRMDSGLVEKVASLNAYAQAYGMCRSARLVASEGAALQAQRIAERASLSSAVATFTTREDALAWLAEHAWDR